MPDDTPEDIDELMSKIDLDRPDLDRIIAYQRKQRALREAGVKTRKPKMEMPATSSLSELLSSIPKPAAGVSKIRRR